MNKYWKLVSMLSVVGILLASYLLYSYLYRPSFQPCSINSSINCDAVIKGPVSTFLGLPTALYGLIGYVVILTSSLLRRKKLLFGVSLFGTIFCLRITFIEVFILKVICPVCLICQIIMITILILSLKLLKTANSKHKQPAY